MRDMNKPSNEELRAFARELKNEIRYSDNRDLYNEINNPEFDADPYLMIEAIEKYGQDYMVAIREWMSDWRKKLEAL